MKAKAKGSLLKAFLLPIGFSLMMFFLFSCSATETYAPVVNAWQDPSAMKSRYRVQKDDTIYSIALSFDMDYRDLVSANHLTPPYRLKTGQTLTMQIKSEKRAAPEIPSTEPAITVYAVNDSRANARSYQEIDSVPLPEKNAKQPPPEVNIPELELKIPAPHKTVEVNQDKIVVKANPGRWLWPARGKVLKEFSLQTEGGNKGIDIAGHMGDPVRAVAPGKIVYCGSGLRGYGNLVIIKHSDNYLSAYAHNRRLLVKEGDVVKAGAEIAKMGQNNSGQVLLHFEIRRNGKPVNPLLYL